MRPKTADTFIREAAETVSVRARASHLTFHLVLRPHQAVTLFIPHLLLKRTICLLCMALFK